MVQLDHLVVAARTLAEGVAYVESVLGMPIPTGGKHPLMATHNHLLALGDGCFLEVIAPDPEARPQRRRWFNLDDPAFLASLARPRLTHWVVRTNDLAAALSSIPHAQGPAITVTRGALTWQIGVPDDGSLAFDGAFPTFIEWGKGPLPVSAMTDHGCRLKRFTISHPQADSIEGALAPHLADQRLAYASGSSAFTAEIATPQGIKILR